jgi:hypothetical protein
MRSLAAGVLAGIAIAALAFLQVRSAEQTVGARAPEPPGGVSVTPLLGETVNIVHTGDGSQLTGQLLSVDQNWLVVKVGEAKFWVSRPQVVYIQYPAPKVPILPPAE